MTTETATPVENPFIARLLKLDAGQRAELRRALQLDDPSLHPPIFRYVEPFVAGQSNTGRRAHYLVASLFGMIEKELGAEERRPRITLAKAIRRYDLKTRSDSGEEISPMERRFLALLDSDNEELPHRLRQTLRMLTSGQDRITQPLDWADLLEGLKSWNSDYRTTQTKWARDFYQSNNDSKSEEETK